MFCRLSEGSNQVRRIRIFGEPGSSNRHIGSRPCLFAAKNVANKATNVWNSFKDPSWRDKRWKLLTTCLSLCIFNTPKTNSNSTWSIQGFQSRLHLSNCWSSLYLSPSLSPCCSSGNCGNHSWRLLQKTTRHFGSKIHVQALGAASSTAWASLTGKHQHIVFPSQVVLLLAVTTDQVAWGKFATTLAILT